MKASGNKVPVFEEAQQCQVEGHGLDHIPFGPLVIAGALGLFHQQSVDIVDADGGEHDKDIGRLFPAVKNQVDHQQDRVAPF